MHDHVLIEYKGPGRTIENRITIVECFFSCLSPFTDGGYVLFKSAGYILSSSLALKKIQCVRFLNKMRFKLSVYPGKSG